MTKKEEALRRAALKKAEKLKREHRLFMTRSLAAFNNLRARCGDLTFDVAWLRNYIHGALPYADPYLGTPITVKDFSIDHRTPVSRGGTSEPSNLDVVSKASNLAKGNLSREEFRDLMSLIRMWPAEARNDLLGRLKSGGAIKRLRFFGKKKRP